VGGDVEDRTGEKIDAIIAKVLFPEVKGILILDLKGKMGEVENRSKCVNLPPGGCG